MRTVQNKWGGPMKAFHVALALFLLGAPVAGAADVPVNYTVDDRVLRAAAAGTILTFELFTDAACTSLVHTQMVAIENVTIISRLKRFKPVAAATPPKTTELQQTLTGVTPALPLYLKVTGTGVTAVGGACQAQLPTPSVPGQGLVRNRGIVTTGVSCCGTCSCSGGAFACCPGAKKVIGGGYSTDSSDSALAATQNQPYFDSCWYASWPGFVGGAYNWTTWAICADVD